MSASVLRGSRRHRRCSSGCDKSPCHNACTVYASCCGAYQRTPYPFLQPAIGAPLSTTVQPPGNPNPILLCLCFYTYTSATDCWTQPVSCRQCTRTKFPPPTTTSSFALHPERCRSWL
eukprot:1415119-Rhodomonas_salina.3